MQNSFLRLLLAGLFLITFEVFGPNVNSAELTKADEFSNASSLRIKFLGYSELSGDYTVGEDQIVSFPVIGRISISGLVPSELEDLLARKASEITKREAYVTVEVVEYRPIFVTGAVQTPGSYQWKPGMNVLQAVSVSGGIYRERSTVQNSAMLMAAADTTLNQVRQSTANLKISLAILARLFVELKGEDVIPVPEKLVKLVGRAEAMSLINFQKSLLIDQKRTLETQTSLFQISAEESQEQLNALTTQKKLVSTQLELQRTILASYEKLLAKSSISKNTYLNERMRVMDLEARSATIDVAITSAKSRITTMKREIENLRQQRRQQIHARIEPLEREAAQQEIAIESARVAYRRLTGRSVPSMNRQNKKRVIEFAIVRKSKGKSEKLTAHEFSDLLPQDILIVTDRTNDSAQIELLSRSARQRPMASNYSTVEPSN